MSATYQVDTPADPATLEKRVTTAVRFAIVASVIALASFAVAGWTLTHPPRAGGSQTAQVQLLGRESTRMAAQLAAADSKLSADGSKLSQYAAAISTLEAEHAKTVTCSDLRHMDLTATTGGNVVADGVVDLSQSPVPLPENCTSG